MAVVDHDIRPSCFVVDHIDAVKTFAIDFSPVDRTLPETVPQHPKLYERQRYAFAEEHFAYTRRDFGKGVSHAADDKILKQSSVLDEWSAVLMPGEETVFYYAVW